MAFDWSEQPALVTGAGSGIGRAIALALARCGAPLCLVGRNRGALEDVATTARRSSPRVACVVADLSSDPGCEQVASALRTGHGRVGILVHAAAGYARGPVRSAPSSDFDALYQVNLRAPYLLTQLLLPLLTDPPGQIVFLNSSVVSRPAAHASQYAATKHALRAVADALREEVNPQGIRVLSLYLGRTATAMQARVHQLEGAPYAPERLLQPEDVATLLTAVLALPRTAEVTDIHMRPMMKA